MERLTFDGNFCDIAQCRENPCPYNGSCSQREVWERQKWIPVTERLPENGERVLAYCKDRVIHDVKWSWVQNAWFDKVTGCEYFEGFVTHWMPLPEEPEEE